ncbi:allantoate amidohydrolase [Asaia siamensis]|uniref:Zn-dependent hydrolase n=1 Tax=Asaia siamensis TaxID=110479 RepID=A0ABQ1MC75_9PROT|nr:allantoate amidohydrolase [Asaia siamensis]GBR03642.1 allantoate amidohydrolase [Asaia siamensis NRIC 0323]GGC38422.1 Zn-dependent hydrolase [Asaia siamensis]
MIATSKIQAGGARAKARCDELGTVPYSDQADGLFRPYLGPAHKATLGRLAQWMDEAGMSVETDAVGNIIGHYAGTTPDAPVLLLGSHVDSVRDGGRYDGMLGVMLGIEAVAHFSRSGQRFPFALEVIGFGDEEGSRFSTYMMGSRSAAGLAQTIDEGVTDREGITLRQALADWGLSSIRFRTAKRENVLAYIEAHIEQAPHLERAGLPVGLVRGIASQYRYRVTIKGQAAHAGTAMHERRDALAAAAEAITAIESIGAAGPDDLVTTVGFLTVENGAPNVVPGHVVMTVDIRAVTPGLREEAARQVLETLEAISRRRGVALECEQVQDLQGALCNETLNATLREAIIEATGHVPPVLLSQAGHDAMIMAHLAPMTMLFIRCEGGISHNPAEAVESDDVEAAHRTLVSFIKRVGEER